MMDTHDISTAKDPGLRASMAALQRAAALARQTAMQTETHLVIMEGGKLVRLSADELREITSDGLVQRELFDYTQNSIEEISMKAMELRHKQDI
jgi:hypothetical protein